MVRAKASSASSLAVIPDASFASSVIRVSPFVCKVSVHARGRYNSQHTSASTSNFAIPTEECVQLSLSESWLDSPLVIERCLCVADDGVHVAEGLRRLEIQRELLRRN